MTTAYSTRTAIGIDLSRVTLSQHFLAQAVAKGITAAQIRDALTKPYQVTDVLRYPGQKRYCGRGVHGTPGVAVVVDVEDMRAITLYLDGVVTEMRTDQRGDLAAQNSRRLASIR